MLGLVRDCGVKWSAADDSKTQMHFAPSALQRGSQVAVFKHLQDADQCPGVLVKR
jgi:hypothetical protein